MCVCLCACVCDGYSGGPFSKLHSHCAIISQREGETRYRPYNGAICFSFVYTVWGSVCL